MRLVQTAEEEDENDEELGLSLKQALGTLQDCGTQEHEKEEEEGCAKVEKDAEEEEEEEEEEKEEEELAGDLIGGSQNKVVVIADELPLPEQEAFNMMDSMMESGCDGSINHTSEHNEQDGPDCYLVQSNAGLHSAGRPVIARGPVAEFISPRLEEPELDEACFHRSDTRESGSQYAFVSTLFGSKVGYCIDALVLGEALRTHHTKYPYILLITDDVPDQWKSVLSKVGWELRSVEYLNGDHFYCHGSRGRFSGVFTKLHALNLIEFDKIVLLDLDLLVRESIDDLFDRPTPSAMRRHASGDFVDQELIKASCFLDDRGHLFSGINAGVMVMRPSAQDFEEMVEEIKDDKEIPHYLRSGQPEQDYLTRFYRNEWHHLSVRYNYQPHQLAFTDRRGLEKCERLTVDYFQDVSIVHFSASVKPRDLLINPQFQQYLQVNPEQRGIAEMKYAEDVLLKQYMQGIHTDRRRGAFSRLHPDAIEAQLRAATRASTGEWFHHWHALEERFVELTFLVESMEFLAEEPVRQPRSSRSRSNKRRSRSRRRGRGRGFKRSSGSRSNRRGWGRGRR